MKIHEDPTEKADERSRLHAGVVDTGDFCQFILMPRELVWPQLLGQLVFGSHAPSEPLGVTMLICQLVQVETMNATLMVETNEIHMDMKP